MPLNIPYGTETEGETVVIDGRTYRPLMVDAKGRSRISDPRERAISKTATRYTAATLAPHGGTQRTLYTVPAGKRCIVEAALVFFIRDGSTATPGRNGGWLRCVTAGGAIIDNPYLQMVNGAVNASGVLNLAGAIWLVAGDTVALWTEDYSSGGTLAYTLNWVGTEFDV